MAPWGGRVSFQPMNLRRLGRALTSTRTETCGRLIHQHVSMSRNRGSKAIAADRSNLAHGAGLIAKSVAAVGAAVAVVGQALRPVMTFSRHLPKDNLLAARVLRRVMSSRNSCGGQCDVRAVTVTEARLRRTAGPSPTMPIATEVARRRLFHC